MLDKQAALEIIQESLDSLARSGTLKSQITVGESTVLMGRGADSGLDSLGFVNFVMDVEERLQHRLDNEFPIVLSEIDAFDVNNPVLDAGVLADHLVSLTGNP